MKAKIAIRWDPIDKIFIRKNYSKMTLNQLLSAVNDIRPASQKVNMPGLRHQLRRMGLSKGIQIHWSPDDVSFLLSHYKKIGNVEMAAILNKRRKTYRKINEKKSYRLFTKKHIQKKMNLLGLHRTSEQIKKIMKRNLTTTNYRVLTAENNFYTQGIRQKYEEESTLIRNGKRYIKINSKFIPYTRWFYHNFIEPIPEGYVVYHLDCDMMNDDPDNLACMSRGKLKQFDRYWRAIKLLEYREKKLIEKLPLMNYDKHKEAVLQMHSELNRIRRILSNINNKMNNYDK